MSGYGFHILGHYNFRVLTMDAPPATGKQHLSSRCRSHDREHQAQSKRRDYLQAAGDRNLQPVAIYRADWRPLGLNRDLRDLSTLISELAQRFAEPNQLKNTDSNSDSSPFTRVPAAFASNSDNDASDRTNSEEGSKCKEWR